MKIKKIKNIISIVLATAITVTPGSTYAASLYEANIEGLDLYLGTNETYRKNTDAVMDKIPDEIILYHKKLGMKLSFFETIPAHQYSSKLNKDALIIGTYTSTDGSIEISVPFHRDTYYDDILTPAHEFGHFIYDKTLPYWTAEMRDTLSELYRKMTDTHFTPCYDETETFAYIYSNLKYYESLRDTDEQAYFQPFMFESYQIGKENGQNFLELYGGLFKKAEQIMIDLYNDKTPEKTIHGPSDYMPYVERPIYNNNGPGITN